MNKLQYRCENEYGEDPCSYADDDIIISASEGRSKCPGKTKSGRLCGHELVLLDFSGDELSNSLVFAYSSCIAVFVMSIYPFFLYNFRASLEQIPPTQLTLITLFLILIVNAIFGFKLFLFFQQHHSKEDVLPVFIAIIFTGLSNIVLFAGLYYLRGIDATSAACASIECQNIIKGNIADSLYFSIVTWTTLGYGDMKPIKELRLFSALQAFMGYLYMAILVGIFLNRVQGKTEPVN